MMSPFLAIQCTSAVVTRCWLSVPHCLVGSPEVGSWEEAGLYDHAFTSVAGRSELNLIGLYL